MNVPELMAPAGDLEKLKVAVACGADAVYIGAREFGLRAKAKNFELPEMAEGIRFAHDRGRRVYVTANIFAHNADIDRMPEFMRDVRDAGADALIISDPGVFALAQETVPEMDIHISTQANNTNFKSALFWQSLGAKRIVIARELSLDEISRIHQETNLGLEAFVHGAMCVSYSGRCLLSAYMTHRDSNMGACSQPCRWEYAVSERTRGGEYMEIDEDAHGTYIFNSKDLCMIEHIPELLHAGITSFKIEGRMKTPYYVGCVVKAYREAIDDYLKDPEVYYSRIARYAAEVRKVSHRSYTTGFYLPDGEQQVYASSSYIRDHDFVAIVLDYDSASGVAVIEQRNKFSIGDEVEVFRSVGDNYKQTVEALFDANGLEVQEAPHPRQTLSMRFDKPVKEFDMLRRAK